MPRDLLELYGHGSTRRLTVRTTEDDSTTRLRLQLRATDWANTSLSAELPVRDVQQLAGALLEWLMDGGHELPELPDVVDEDGDAGWLPPVQPEPGHLLVRREDAADGGVRVFIDRADPWVLCSLQLWDQLREPENPWTSWDGDGVVVIRDSTGATVAYKARPELTSEPGTVLLERSRPLLPDVTAARVIPEHTRD